MEEDILNYLYQLSCFVGHPVYLHRNDIYCIIINNDISIFLWVLFKNLSFHVLLSIYLARLQKVFDVLLTKQI